MRIVNIPKKNGTFRTIYIPDQHTKEVYQSYVKDFNYIVSTHCHHAHGFIKGRSPVTAAKKHIGYKYTICWDIKDFFDTVRYHMVENYIDFRTYNNITVDGIPRQGLPTSPLIANLAAISLDKMIINYLDGVGVYTRYADDLTISFNNSEYIEHLLKDIPRISKYCGFILNNKKTRVQSSKFGRRIICGVAVGDEDKTYATRKMRRRLRAAQHQSKLLVKNREKAKAQARGLREWCMQRLPVQFELDQRTKNRGVVLAANLKISDRREERFKLRQQIANFPVNDFLKITKHFKQESILLKRDLVGLAATFGNRWMDWIKGAKNQELHDLLYWLPIDVLPNDGLSDRLFVWRRELNWDLKFKDIILVSRYWSNLSEDEKNLSLSSLAYKLRGFKYKRAKSRVFANEAATHSVSEKYYYRWENRWLRALSVLTFESIPKFSFNCDGFKVSILPKHDPRCLFIGEHVNCCQHPGGVADTSAWHSVESSNGAVLAIEKEDIVIAESWLWRNQDVLVADNCEALDGYGQALPKLYTIFAEKVINKLGINEVRIGANGDIDMVWPKASLRILRPAGCYSDAKVQHIIKSAPNES